MNDLANRPRRAPDSGRYDAAAWPPLIAQGNDPAAPAQRVRLDQYQATGRRRYRPALPHSTAPTDPLGRRPRVDLPCQVHDPDLWFAAAPADLEHAKALCAGCPARLVCLTGALDRHEPAGVWGGHIFDHGRIVTHKRPRGRPSKHTTASPALASLVAT